MSGERPSNPNVASIQEALQGRKELQRFKEMAKAIGEQARLNRVMETLEKRGDYSEGVARNLEKLQHAFEDYQRVHEEGEDSNVTRTIVVKASNDGWMTPAVSAPFFKAIDTGTESDIRDELMESLHKRAIDLLDLLEQGLDLQDIDLLDDASSFAA